MICTRPIRSPGWLLRWTPKSRELDFRAGAGACRHLEGNGIAVDILGLDLATGHGLAHGDGQVHDDIMAAHRECGIGLDGDVQVQVTGLAAVDA